ncbi:MAG: sodium/proline symporter PutP [Phascolarctobacterium sp.]|nr:MAG: sodium/proline symporter PutP [Phascolarctobacterium sp.]
MEQDLGSILAYALYFIVLFAIGLYHMKDTGDMQSYMLGGRKIGPWVSAMSAEASDMSGWMLMGLPGYAYVAGVSAFWIAIGLALGTWLNWRFVAQRLRIYTKIANDSITLPDFFENRYQDKSKILRIVSAVFIFIFFLIYTASGFVAGGRLFTTVFDISYVSSLLITAGIVIFYTFTGGYLAVCRTDFFQGTLMFFAIIVVPVTGIMIAGGPAETISSLHALNPNYFNMLTDATGLTLSFTAIVSLIGWGLGYFGQPHILVRFMSISSAKEIPQATRIAMVWVIFSLFFAVASGLVGRVVLGDSLTGVNAETVFMVMNEQFFNSFMAAIIISAILGAIMSTSSGQLLVTASAISTDFYQALLRKNASQKELVFVSRIAVILVSACSLALAYNPNNYILDLVAYAWAGFGASFGPLMLFSLFWKRTTLKGAVAGVFFGGSTVLLWKECFASTGLYEIIPGFIVSCIAIFIVSLLDKKPSDSIIKDFETTEKHINDL